MGVVKAGNISGGREASVRNLYDIGDFGSGCVLNRNDCKGLCRSFESQKW